jgi:FKBP-type peptidyl-prolyl cis-trans isomerase (trigger factor)
MQGFGEIKMRQSEPDIHSAHSLLVQTHLNKSQGSVVDEGDKENREGVNRRIRVSGSMESILAKRKIKATPNKLQTRIKAQEQEIKVLIDLNAQKDSHIGKLKKNLDKLKGSISHS